VYLPHRSCLHDTALDVPFHSLQSSPYPLVGEMVSRMHGEQSRDQQARFQGVTLNCAQNEGGRLKGNGEPGEMIVKCNAHKPQMLKGLPADQASNPIWLRGVDLNPSPALIPRKLLIPRYAKTAQSAKKANLFYTFFTLCLWSELSGFGPLSTLPPTPRLSTQLWARIIWVFLFP
jgi:hypothetical protein